MISATKMGEWGMFWFTSKGFLVEEFKWRNAHRPTYAMIKLSIGSNVDFHDPKLTHFLRLIGDQTLGQNNIASFDKEKRHYLSGMFPEFEQSNGVMVIKRLLSLPTDDAAKAIAYVYQLEAERQIDAELKRMATEGDINHEEWKFIDAVLMMSVGNVMGSITMSRYGGAATRLESWHGLDGDDWLFCSAVSLRPTSILCMESNSNIL